MAKIRKEFRAEINGQYGSRQFSVYLEFDDKILGYDTSKNRQILREIAKQQYPQEIVGYSDSQITIYV
jgi:hypothetical protein